MVAQTDGVDAERLHRRDDRMATARFAPPPHHALQNGVAHRVAMQEIAVVEQERIGGLGPPGADQRGGPGKACRDRGQVRQVVIRQDMHMHIRRRHDPQGDLRRCTDRAPRCGIGHSRRPFPGCAGYAPACCELSRIVRVATPDPMTQP